MERMTTNLTNLVQRMAQRRQGELDKRRDLAAEAGWPKDPTVDDFNDLYLTDGYAARVVEVMPLESWQVQPLVYETEANTVTKFERAWDEMSSQINGQLGIYGGQYGSPIWEAMMRADILSGIGTFGIILLGLDDSDALETPVVIRPGVTRRLAYMRTLSESQVRIEKYDEDPSSPRFGMPELYAVNLLDPSNERTQTFRGGLDNPALVNTIVHWTRILHIADNRMSSEFFGEPRCKQVLPFIMNLRKIIAGGAEMFYKGGWPGIFFSTNPALGSDVSVDMDSFRDQMEQYENSLKKWLFGQGTTAQQLMPGIADPMNHILSNIEGICIRLAMPKRIFLGSERGELASTQDDQAWNDRVALRQKTHLIPNMIVPFCERLIVLGVLPLPKALSIHWPDLESQTAAQKADVASKRIDGLARYINGQVNQLMSRRWMLVNEMHLTDDEADECLAEADAEAAQMEQDMLAKGIDPATGQPIGADPNAPPGSPAASAGGTGTGTSPPPGAGAPQDAGLGGAFAFNMRLPRLED